MKKVIVIGSGGHAKVVVDILNSMEGIEIIGITSISLQKGDTFMAYPVIGDDDSIQEWSRDILLAMGLGGYRDNAIRFNVFNTFKKQGFSFINAIHPSANISKTVTLGEGVVVFPGVSINTEVEIGSNSIVATGATIDHETKIGNHVLVSAGVTVGAYCDIKENVVIALGAKIISGILIGRNSLIAAGAVVIKNIDENSKVFGVPAKSK